MSPREKDDKITVLAKILRERGGQTGPRLEELDKLVASLVDALVGPVPVAETDGKESPAVDPGGFSGDLGRYIDNINMVISRATSTLERLY